MSGTDGVSEGGNSDGPGGPGGDDHGVSDEDQSSVNDAMSAARDDADSGSGQDDGFDDAASGDDTMTEDDAVETQERMEAEGRAARESFERGESGRMAADAASEALADQTYADALDQETAALNAAAEAAPPDTELSDTELAEFDDVALEPSLREQILSDPDAITDPSDLAALDAFLESDAGIAATEQYEFDRALQNSELTEQQVFEAMGHFTAGRDVIYDADGQIMTLEDGSVAFEVLVADGTGGFDALVPDDDRTPAEVAADYAQALNETVAAVANSRWSFAAGLAFDAVALAAGGPVRFAVNMAAGEAAAGLLEQGLEAGVNYLAERTDMEAEDISHLAIAGATILGGAVLGWQGVKAIARNLPEQLDRLSGLARRSREDDRSTPTPDVETARAYGDRTYNPENAGGPLRQLDWRNADVTPEGIADVRLHLERFDDFAPNAEMLDRLDRIADGTLEATDFDRRFYTHELRELERTRTAGIDDGVALDYDQWNDLHTATLEDFGITERLGADGHSLYHPDAWALRGE